MLNLALGCARTDEKHKSVAVAKAILQFGPAKTDPVRRQAERLISALA